MSKKKNILIILLCLISLWIKTLTSYAITLPSNEMIYDVEKFIGSWYMQTVVTSSNCPFVITGTTTESKIEIKPQKKTSGIKKIFKITWIGGKWAKSNGTIKLLNNKEAITERITRIKTKDNNLWKSVLIDHFKFLDLNKMESESIVLQYKNKKFIGEYRTYSILTKNDVDK